MCFLLLIRKNGKSLTNSINNPSGLPYYDNYYTCQSDHYSSCRKERTALNLAHTNGHKKCEQTLGFCEWNLQKHAELQQRQQEKDAAKERNASVRRAHQFSDSRYATWLSGPRGPEYMVHTQNPVSMQDVARFRKRQSQQNKSSCTQTQVTKAKHTVVGDDESRVRLAFDYSYFDPLRAQQVIPSTHHILTYSDPSSTQLQPRSVLNPQGYVQHPPRHTEPSQP